MNATIPQIDKQQLGDFLRTMNAMNWGMWGSPDNWPAFGDVAYTLNQYEGPTTVIHFNEIVQVGDKIGKNFGVGKARKCGIKGLQTV